MREGIAKMISVNSINEELARSVGGGPLPKISCFILVKGIVSPMSDADIAEIAPLVTSWFFRSSVQRTSVVLETASENDAMDTVNQLHGLSFLGHKLELSFLDEAEQQEMWDTETVKMSTIPEHYYRKQQVDPNGPTMEARRVQGRTIVENALVTGPPEDSWVNHV